MSTRTTEFAARITGDADGALAALEKVKVRVRETAAASESANTKVANSATVLIKNSEKAARGVAAITQALYAMEAEGSARILAIGGAIGSFADLLGPGGKVVSGIAIVASSIVALFLQAKEKSAEARKAIEDDIKALVNAGDFSGITKRLETLDQGTAAASFQDGIKARRETIALLEEELRLIDTGARKYATYNERSLQRREIKDVLDRERKALTPLVDEYNRLDRALKSTSNAPKAKARGLEGQPITSTADSPEAIARRAKEAQDAAKKAADEVRKNVAQIIKDIDKLIGEQTARALEAEELAIKQLGDESAARAKSTEQLEAQVVALQDGTRSYEALLIAQAQQTEVEKALAIAKAGDIELTQEQIDKIRSQVAENARLLKLLEALKALDGKNPFEIPESFDRLGDLAEKMSMVASAAAGIASAFGEVGRNIAGVLGQTSQLLTNLQRAQKSGVFTDLNGKERNVGFLGALQGKAGAAGVASAVSSSLGIVGAVASIADSLDLFGSRAREQARQLRQRAIAFNNALEGFAIAQRTDLESALQQNIAGANQVAGAGGLTTNFKSVADITAQVEALRAAAATLNKRDGAPLLRIASQLEALATTAAENEVKIREANASALARLREDLDVRRVALAQGSEAGDQARAALELQRQELEIRKQYGPAAEQYIADLKAITAAEAALAAETKRRATILQSLSDDNSFLGGTSAEQLRRGFDALGQAFTDFEGAFDGLDLSTREGLDAAKAQIRAIYTTLAVDGVSEAERPIIEFLRQLLGQVDGAIGQLPEILDPIAYALEAFQERVQLFNTSLPSQLAELSAILRTQFGDAFSELLTGDFGSAGGLAAFKESIGAKLQEILADGVISETERPLFDALKRLFGLASQAITEGEAEATRIAEEALAGRQRRRTGAANRVDLFNLTGLDAFRVELEALGPAFSSLLGQFDLTTLGGIEGASDVLRGVFNELDSLSDEEILNRFGLTRDELVAALLDTSNGLDGLRGSLKDVAAAAIEAARASAEFTDEISQDFLRSQGRGQEADINAARAKRDERLKKAAQLGLGPDILAQIEQIFQADLAEIAAKYAPAVSSALDAAAASSTGTAGSFTGARGNASRGARNTTLAQDFGGLSQILAESLAGLLREIAINTSESGAIVSALIGRGAFRPLSSLSFPTFPTATGGSGGIVINIGPITIGSLNPMGMAPVEAANQAVREISRQIGIMVSKEANFLGGTSVA